MHKGKRGFTLLEIMIVVILISLLAGFASVKIIGRFQRAKIKIAESTIKGTLGVALGQFYVDNDFFPTTDQGLAALVEKPAGSPEPRQYDAEGYLDELPLDPWDTPYSYECPGRHNPRRYDLWSAGPDRQSGTDDDIVNWRR